MTTSDAVARHYTRGDLLERLRTALRADGIDPDKPTLAQLAPYDQFHGRGEEATMDAAAIMPARAGDHLLDIGCGIGGPARYLAHRFGCRVSGIDLTPEFCDVATALTKLLGMQDQVDARQGDALKMPFADATFDGAYSMNVSMNIADKAGFYREIHRVLKPGGWLMLSEIAQGPGEPPTYPTPWAARESESFLATPAQTRAGLEAAGFRIEKFRDTLKDVLDYAARSRAAIERGEKPPHRAVQVIHGAAAREMAANTTRNFANDRLVPIELLARKR
jgi:ubiquinone/menaquinone biosynthesis C-methylase UbiE